MLYCIYQQPMGLTAHWVILLICSHSRYLREVRPQKNYRGHILMRTHDIPKNHVLPYVLQTIFGSEYYGPPSIGASRHRCMLVVL